MGIYDINQFDPNQNQGFDFGDFANDIGDTLDSAVKGFGSNFDANALNAVAIANLNKAQADAIKSNAENKKQITKYIFTILIISILAVVAVTIASKFWK